MNHSVIDYMIFVYSTVEKKEVTYVPRFSSIDEANNLEVPPLIIEPTQIHLGPLYLGVNSIPPHRQDRPGGKY